jgi:enoyl-CoA hydratase/carnithine racemase
MRRWAERCHEIVRLLRGSPKPLLAAINGTAVGGGLEMTLHCDLRFAATDARLGQPEINIGFIPPIATTQALARLIGRPRAIRYLYDGNLVQATEALEWGLVDELVEPGTLRARVQAYGEELANKSPAALAAIRRTVTLGGGMTFEDGMAFELKTVVELAGTPDFAEGVDAFLTKRQPKWKTS